MDISQRDEKLNAMQNVKQRFFAMRNGVVADSLRHCGSPFRIIFGLNLPQLQDIAAVFGKDRALAEALWANTSTRESRLLAPMLVDPAEFTFEDALSWIDSLSGSAEEIDLLCHSLLKRMPRFEVLINYYKDSANPYERYLALRLSFGLLVNEPYEALFNARVEQQRNHPFTIAIATQLCQDAEYLLEG